MKVETLRRDCPSRSPHFNPLRPCGRRLVANFPLIYAELYFNPLRPCGRRQVVPSRLVYGQHISIHSARVGGDVIALHHDDVQAPISIHSARVGGDGWLFFKFKILFKFQSTPPVWAETR